MEELLAAGDLESSEPVTAGSYLQAVLVDSRVLGPLLSFESQAPSQPGTLMGSQQLNWPASLTAVAGGGGGVGLRLLEKLMLVLQVLPVLMLPVLKEAVMFEWIAS